jgi:hypothetical protein
MSPGASSFLDSPPDLLGGGLGHRESQPPVEPGGFDHLSPARRAGHQRMRSAQLRLSAIVPRLQRARTEDGDDECQRGDGGWEAQPQTSWTSPSYSPATDCTIRMR